MTLTINQAIDFFITNTKYHSNDIKQCDLIYDGYTNSSFCLKLNNNKKFFIKLSKHNAKDLINESYIYKKYLKDIYIHSNNQNYILKWVDHIKLDNKYYANYELIKKIFEQINIFHQLKININLLEFDYFQYQDIQSKKYLMFQYYKKILSKYDFMPKIISHGDVNFKNILYTKNTHKIYLIDFEWARLNYEWFDYINFISENCISNQEVFNILKQTLNMNLSDQEIYELFFIKWFFSWAWAKKNQHFDNIKQYQKFAWKQTKIFFNYLKK